MSQDFTDTKDQEQSGAKIETDPLLSPTIETTIVESEVVSTQEPSKEEQPQGSEERPVVTPQKRFIPNWSNIIACVLLLILVGEHVVPLVWTSVDALLHSKAVVTLFAAKHHVQFTYTFLAVTGTAERQRHQIPSRLLSVTTATKTETITTTGIGYTPPAQASGVITFYNEAPYAQIIQAGTVVTGGSGIQVVTDQSVTIAAGNGGTNGSASAPAHTLQAGAHANIAPLDINGLCCLGGILAKNSVAFTGGQDPQAYPTVSKVDLQAAAHQLAGLLDPLVKTGLQSQIAQTERVLTSLYCRYAISSTPKVGERATTARVSVSETCQTQVYDEASLQEQVRLLFATDATNTLPWAVVQGNSFTLTFAPPRLLDTTHHTYQLAVTASGTIVFQLSEAEVHRLLTQIAGKPITQAQRVLLQVQGVQGVSIQPARQGEPTLPADPNQIQIVIS